MEFIHRNSSVPFAELLSYRNCSVPHNSVPLTELMPYRSSSVQLAEFIKYRNRPVPQTEI